MSQPFGPVFEPEPIPESLSFRLPDDTQVISEEASPGAPINIQVGGTPLCTFAPQQRSLRISPYGIVNDNRAQSALVLRFVPAEGRNSISNGDLWTALYGLWLRKPDDDVVPFELIDSTENAANLRKYLSKHTRSHTEPH